MRNAIISTHEHKRGCPDENDKRLGEGGGANIDGIQFSVKRDEEVKSSESSTIYSNQKATVNYCLSKGWDC